MEMILVLLIGLLIGGLIGYFIFKLTLQKSFVPTTDLDVAEEKISALQLENVTRLSKDEVATKYVSKELHDNINSNLSIAKKNLETELAANKEHQVNLLWLTGESEQKLSKTEVEKNYVAKDSFDIVNRKLDAAEKELDKRAQTILDLNNKLTEFQQK